MGCRQSSVVVPTVETRYPVETKREFEYSGKTRRVTKKDLESVKETTFVYDQDMRMYFFKDLIEPKTQEEKEMKKAILDMEPQKMVFTPNILWSGKATGMRLLIEDNLFECNVIKHRTRMCAEFIEL